MNNIDGKLPDNVIDLENYRPDLNNLINFEVGTREHERALNELVRLLLDTDNDELINKILKGDLPSRYFFHFMDHIDELPKSEEVKRKLAQLSVLLMIKLEDVRSLVRETFADKNRDSVYLNPLKKIFGLDQ